MRKIDVALACVVFVGLMALDPTALARLAGMALFGAFGRHSQVIGLTALLLSVFLVVLALGPRADLIATSALKRRPTKAKTPAQPPRGTRVPQEGMKPTRRPRRTAGKAKSR